MSDAGGKFTVLSAELHDYIVANGAREDEALAAVRESTAALGPVAEMQISPDQGALLTLLARLIGARRAIELGTFTGYSALCIARGLTDAGTTRWLSVKRRARCTSSIAAWRPLVRAAIGFWKL